MPVITSSNNTHLPKNIFFSLSDKAPQVLKIPRNGNRARPKSLIPLSSIGLVSALTLTNIVRGILYSSKLGMGIEPKAPTFAIFSVTIAGLALMCSPITPAASRRVTTSCFVLASETILSTTLSVCPRGSILKSRASSVEAHRSLILLNSKRQRLCISISWSGECGADCCRSFDLGFVKRFFTCFLSSESRETRACVPSSSVTSLYRLADRTEYHRHRSYTLNFRDE
ncbi:hypothetical protein FOVSG1_004123 [Fusarium oxysporum f. sp. vasinfectum]